MGSLLVVHDGEHSIGRSYRGMTCDAGPGVMRYTSSMKTAISVPDHVFEEAEELAHRLEKSRSQLYTEAMVEYLTRHHPDTVTERLNEVLGSVSEEEDRFVTETSRSILEQVEW